GLPEVAHELGIESVEPSRIACLDELAVLAMEGAALPAREGGVENVPHDPAGERQPVAPGLPLLLQDPLPDEPVDRVVHVLGSLRQSLKILRVEALSQHGRDREEVPKVF